MDLGHSPDTGASEGELRSGYALTPSPSHSKNISLFTERRTSERAVSKDGYSSFLFNPLWGFPVVAAGILFVVDQPSVDVPVVLVFVIVFIVREDLGHGHRFEGCLDNVFVI